MSTELKEEIKYRELINNVYEELWSNRNLSIIDETLDPDVKCHETGMEFNSLEEFKKNVITFFNAFEETKITVTNQLVKENVVVVRFVFEGTHKGDFIGIAPTGRKIKFAGLEVIRFVNDKIVEIWAEFDQLGLMKQLGMELKPMELAH